MAKFNFILLICLLAIIAIAAFIISFDIGDFAKHTAGAGDIWWADVPDVEKAYQELKDH